MLRVVSWDHGIPATRHALNCHIHITVSSSRNGTKTRRRGEARAQVRKAPAASSPALSFGTTVSIRNFVTSDKHCYSSSTHFRHIYDNPNTSDPQQVSSRRAGRGYSTPSNQNLLRVPSLRTPAKDFQSHLADRHDAHKIAQDEPEFDSLSEESTKSNEGSSRTHTVMDQQDPGLRPLLLKRLRKSASSQDSWDAFTLLRDLDPDTSHEGRSSKMTYSDIHHLARMLAKERPRTRDTFQKLLALLTFLRSVGGSVHGWEWNLLLDCAAKGSRSTTEKDYQSTLQIYADLQTTQQSPPVAHQLRSKNNAKADIVTFTTILAIAVRSRSDNCIRHASELLLQSNLTPNRVTRLVVLSHLGATGKPEMAEQVIAQLQLEGHDVGIDGLNALMWAHARNGHFELPMGIYRTLRRNVSLSDDSWYSHYTPIADIGEYHIPSGTIPDCATYTLLVQSLAYGGRFFEAVKVFEDLVALPDPPLTTKGRKVDPLSNAHLLPVYRALFLGFARHGEYQRPHSKRGFDSSLISRLLKETDPGPWNSENFHTIFNMFLATCDDLSPSERTIYWIMIAAGRVSGNDEVRMANIWRRLNATFEKRSGWRGRMGRMSQRLANVELGDDFL